jgi:hypothetical protein
VWADDGGVRRRGCCGIVNIVLVGLELFGF